MNDYIKREDVLKYPIRLNHYDKENGSEDFVLGGESVIEYVENLPAADVRENKYGHWDVPVEDGFTLFIPAADVRENKCGHWDMPVKDGFTLFQCSNCGYNRIARTEPNFCEHCGADMR